ncbi:Meiotic recombination protein rec12 [Penicillium rolfsii]|nr:Meiotic recombination protein rec12 [Penicillium rolfsii]
MSMTPETKPLPVTSALSDGQGLVRNYIDKVLVDILHQLSLCPSEGQPSITLRCRPRQATCMINPDNGALEAGRDTCAYRSYSWPGSTAKESWKFSKDSSSPVVFRVLGIIDQALHAGQLISKRDIFYIDPAYFRSQQTVDSVVDDLAFTIGVDRLAFNVEAASKGLVAGRFRLQHESSVIVDANSTRDTMIPRIQSLNDIDISGARWVFIIEKEAVFHRLARSRYPTRATMGDGILITGKGYPDVSTREFVHQLFVASDKYKRPPRFYALVDGDPHGMSIMSTYKYGSIAHLHENARLSLPCLEWLGLRVADAILASGSPGANPVLSLRPSDRRKILAMLRNNPAWSNNGPEPEWRAELQRMLMLNAKAEIEMLYDRDGGLEGWIDRKLFRQE